MNLAAEVPLLAGLPKVELAKLLSDTESLRFSAGETVLAAGEPIEWVYFVVEGEVEIARSEHNHVVPLMVHGPGDLFGELSLLSSRAPKNHQVKALTDVRLCRLPAKRFRRLLKTDPALAEEFTSHLSQRMADTMNELARTKHMLTVYAQEIWSDVQVPHLAEAAAAMTARVPDPLKSSAEGARAERRPARRSWVPAVPLRYLALGVSSGLAILTYLRFGGTPALSFAVVLLWAASNWLLSTMPDYVTALAASALVVLTKIAAPGVAFSGFANPSWFLLLGVLGIGVAVSQSGLLYRVSLHMLRMLPPTYRGQSLALALTGVLFTPLLPSANSRSAMASPLARELSEAMRFPARGRGSAGLAMSSFLGFGQMYFMFFNGTNICMLAWSLLPPSARAEINWVSWLWLGFPLAAFTFIGCYLAILFLYPPEPTPGVSRQTIAAQLQVLGGLTKVERSTATVLSLVLLGFVTQGLHGVDPAWIALPGFLILVAIGIVDRNGLKLLDWSFLLLVGALISLSEVTKTTGISQELTRYISPLLQPLAASPYLFLGGIALLMLLFRLAVPIQQAVMVMVMSLVPVAVQMGYHPFAVAMVVLALSNTWVLPQQNSMYLTVYSGTEERSFTHQQVRPLALLHAAVGVAAVLATVPFWQMLGLIPR